MQESNIVLDGIRDISKQRDELTQNGRIFNNCRLTYEFCPYRG